MTLLDALIMFFTFSVRRLCFGLLQARLALRWDSVDPRHDPKFRTILTDLKHPEHAVKHPTQHRLSSSHSRLRLLASAGGDGALEAAGGEVHAGATLAEA